MGKWSSKPIDLSTKRLNTGPQCGLVVRMLAFYSDSSKFESHWSQQFFCKCCLKERKKNNSYKVGPFKHTFVPNIKRYLAGLTPNQLMQKHFKTKCKIQKLWTGFQYLIWINLLKCKPTYGRMDYWGTRHVVKIGKYNAAMGC